MAATLSDTSAFSFEDHLVRVVMQAAEAWFVGRDVCHVLGLQNESQALAALDGDERQNGVTIRYPMGREQRAIIISEPGVYRLVFRSRKPEAERFKRWLAHDVLPQLRRHGRAEADLLAPRPTATEDPPPGPRDILAEPLMHRLQVLREARCTHGREVARVMWAKLGLPPVPPPPRTGVDEARELLRHLLDQATPGGQTVRALLALALDEDETARLELLGCGIRVFPDREVFVVGNRHEFIHRALRGTAWIGALAHVPILRRLPEAVASGPTWIAGVQQRGTILSARALDEFVP